MSHYTIEISIADSLPVHVYEEPFPSYKENGLIAKFECSHKAQLFVDYLNKLSEVKSNG